MKDEGEEVKRWFFLLYLNQQFLFAKSVFVNLKKKMKKEEWWNGWKNLDELEIKKIVINWMMNKFGKTFK